MYSCIDGDPEKKAGRLCPIQVPGEAVQTLGRVEPGESKCELPDQEMSVLAAPPEAPPHKAFLKAQSEITPQKNTKEKQNPIEFILLKQPSL